MTYDDLTDAAKARATYRTKVRARVAEMSDADLLDSLRTLRDEYDRRRVAAARARTAARRAELDAEAEQRRTFADAARRSETNGDLPAAPTGVHAKGEVQR